MKAEKINVHAIEPVNAPTMQIVKDPISAKPAVWDVTESYCAKGVKKKYNRTIHDTINQAKLNALRKLPTPGTTARKELTVTINGSTSVWTIGKGNEYFSGNQSLSKTLEVLAQSKGNKIQIA